MLFGPNGGALIGTRKAQALARYASRTPVAQRSSPSRQVSPGGAAGGRPSAASTISSSRSSFDGT